MSVVTARPSLSPSTCFSVILMTLGYVYTTNISATIHSTTPNTVPHSRSNPFPTVSSLAISQFCRSSGCKLIVGIFPFKYASSKSSNSSFRLHGLMDPSCLHIMWK